MQNKAFYYNKKRSKIILALYAYIQSDDNILCLAESLDPCTIKCISYHMAGKHVSSRLAQLSAFSYGL